MPVCCGNRTLMSWLCAGAVLLAGIAGAWAVFLESSETSPAAVAETPRIADVLITQDMGLKTIQIRDQTAIVVLQSLLAGGSDFDGSPPAQRKFQVFIHPTDKSSYSYSPSPVWRVDGDRFAWHGNGQSRLLDGSLTDFLEWLRIRRCNQLLRGPDPKLRERGMQLREAFRKEFVDTLIRIANSKNGWFAQAGIREIAEQLSNEPSPANHFLPGDMQMLTRREVTDPDRLVRDELVKLVKQCPIQKHMEDPFGVGSAALQCLLAIGDRATADDLVPLLVQHKEGRLGNDILTALETLYGIPKTYERFGVCGNSTAAEMAKFAREAAAREAAAIKEFLAWQQQHAEATEEQYYDAVVLHWSEMLVHFANAPDQNYSYQNDQTAAPKLQNLLGLGKPLVPALKRRQQATTGWQEKSMLEFTVAFLTGEYDSNLVKELLAGNRNQQRIACGIIAASADDSWNSELVKRLRTPLGSTKVEEVVALRSVAAQALFRSAGISALPAFRDAAKTGFESPMLLQILEHLELPVAQF